MKQQLSSINDSALQQELQSKIHHVDNLHNTKAIVRCASNMIGDKETTQERRNPREDAGSSPPSSSSSGSPPSSSSDANDNSSSQRPTPPSSGNGTPPGTIAKQSVPEVYPQVLALSIAARPLFPGFYKPVVVRNPQVVAITSVFTAQGSEEKEEGLTAGLYPHRRIKIAELFKACAQAKVETVEADEPQIMTPPPSATTEVPKPTNLPQTSFLHNHAITIANVENIYTQPYNKDNQYIRGFMSDIVSVFQDMA
ncbi:ATP-dependent Lon protease pim1 [Paramarasmius palmivorus]|uniref:ATP-dependent Lon protease pim1 n=1 Tax=Paramarasmius palmivorus TaxID=297713 RepID=A0AAW0DKU4_9AGAR